MKNKILLLFLIAALLFGNKAFKVQAQVSLTPTINLTPSPTPDCKRLGNCPTAIPTLAPTTVLPTSVPPTAVPPTAVPPTAKPAIPTPTPTKKPTFVPLNPVTNPTDEITDIPTPEPSESPAPTLKASQPSPTVDQVQSAFVKSVPTIEEISFDPTVLIKSFLLGLLLLLLILFPAEVFNSTLQSNYDEVTGWFKRGWLKGFTRGFGLNKIVNGINGLPTIIAVVIFSALGALLNSQVSPGFELNKANLSLVAGVFLTILVITVFYDLMRGFYLKRRFGVKSKLRTHALGLITALLMIIVSRVANFLPGYMYGIFTGLIYASSLNDEQDGEGLAAATWWLIGLAFIGWFALIPVKAAASAAEPSFLILTAQAMLSSLWTSTLTLLVFGMIPIRFLYGEQVKKWNRNGWLLIYVIGIMLFVHTLLDPAQSFYGKSDKVSLISILILFVGFAVLSFLFWGYFRYRPSRKQTD